MTKNVIALGASFLILTGLAGPASTQTRTGLPPQGVYSIRHIQHHAAQLSLRIRLDHQIDTPWVRTGWDDRKY